MTYDSVKRWRKEYSRTFRTRKELTSKIPPNGRIAHGEHGSILADQAVDLAMLRRSGSARTRAKKVHHSRGIDPSSTSTCCHNSAIRPLGRSPRLTFSASSMTGQ